MAKTETEATNQPSIDSVLRGLTERPNVESTLILSRKDGSIIRASGFMSAEKRPRAHPMANYQSQNKEDGQQINVTGSDDQGSNTMESPAQTLAASVFQFVQIASSFGSTLSTISAEQEAEDSAFRKSDPGQKTVDTDESQAAVADESQVQLLRLRIKHREIIIFPDPQYLCCVVQRIGK